MININISKFYNKSEKDLSTLKTMLIIGNSEYGITNEVIEVSSIEEVVKLYGKKGSIYDSYMTIKDDINDYNISVFILKPYGNHATASFSLNTRDGIVENALSFKSIYSNEMYNDVSFEITENYLKINFPSILELSPKIYHYLEYPNLYLLLKQVNEDTINGESVVLAHANVDEFSEFDESFFVVNKNKNLVGGSSGLNITNEEKYRSLETSYDLIAGVEIDYIIATDTFYNDNVNLYYEDGRQCSFYEQLLSFNINQLQYGIVTVGFFNIDTTNVTLDNVGNYIDKLKEIKYITHSNESLYKYRFLTVVVFDSLYDNYKTKKINPITLISFYLARLNTTENITNKPFRQEISLNLYLEKDDMKRINDLGFLTLRHSPFYNRVVVANGITTYQFDETYKYLTSIFILQNITPGIKSIFEEQLGENIYELNKKRTIDDNITKLLDKKVREGIIEKHDFSIEYDTNNGSISYEISIQNVFMIENFKYIGKLSYFELE